MEDLNLIFKTALNLSLAQLATSQRQFALNDLNVSPSFLSDLKSGRKFGNEETRRKIATALGFPGPQYEDFLNLGRSQLGLPVPRSFDRRTVDSDDLTARGFLTIPFSDNMKLAAGRGGTIPITDDEDSSPVIVHGPSLGLRSNKRLQAFRVGGDSMEPIIAQGGIVLADLSQNNLQNLHEGGIYVLCWDLDDDECAVKRLRWADKHKLLAIESEEKFYPTVHKKPRDIVLIGRVIWAWRQFTD